MLRPSFFFLRRGAFSAFSVGVVSFALLSAQAQALTFGVVNKEKLMKDSPAIKAFQVQVKKAQEDFQKCVGKELQAIDAEAAKLLKQLKDNPKQPASEDFKKKVANLTKRQQEIQARNQKKAKDFEAEVLKAMGKIKKDVDMVVKVVAQEKKLDVAFDEISAIYFKPQNDITADVAKELAKRLKNVDVKLPNLCGTAAVKKA